MEVSLLCKGSVGPRAVDGDSDQLRAEALELAKHLVVQRELVAADRTPIGGVEREDDRVSAEIRQRHRLIGCAAQGELRGSRACRQRSRPPRVRRSNT